MILPSAPPVQKTLFPVVQMKRENPAEFIILHSRCYIFKRHLLTLLNVPVILPPGKFLQFDWLRAEIFQLNLKYLLVKITLTMTEFLWL